MVAVVEITLLCLGRERPTVKQKYEGLFCTTAQKAQERTLPCAAASLTLL